MQEWTRLSHEDEGWLALEGATKSKFRKRLQALLLHREKEQCWPRGALDNSEALSTYAPERELSVFVRSLRKSAHAWQVDMIRWHPGLERLLAAIDYSDCHASCENATSAIEDMLGDPEIDSGGGHAKVRMTRSALRGRFA